MPLALIVDDDSNTRTGLQQLVEAEGFATLGAATLEDAREAMAKNPDIVLLDLVLPDGSGLELLREREGRSDIPIVVTTGHASLESSIEALRLGATDYMLKPVNMSHLRGILSRIAGPAELRAEVSELREELRSLGRFGKLVGTSPPMQKLYDEIARVAPTGATVLIMGESGTGKELVAETIHMLSRRHHRPFLAVNCGAVSPNLIESELFGHEKGSFTGANRQHQGYFERANGGTLFLDEITEMPLELQVKLLRVLESRMVQRIGSNQPIETDVRVIAATNRNPEEALKAGKLRRDLLYRLQVFPLHVAPLRERLDDVAPLARHFLAELNKRSNTDKTFAPMALERMRRYRWPGNVRELWNVVQRAFILADGDIISDFSIAQDVHMHQDGHAGYIRIPLGTKLAEVEERLILTTLQECTTREEAAKKLGISIKTLYNRLRSYSQRQ
ncbi:MAG TPA: sigma-54 dependent transcriptional regulator [Casimicrobiaceae bacterium]|nr:sigma-54 dependent transcriptional regulator [Casimicrobiaceae bacterium]